MQDHEFEKKVHTQMEDLRVSPSEGVWNHVEKELRKGKRKRRFLLLLPLLLLVSAAGYWWVQQPGQPSDSIAEKQLVNDSKNNPATSSNIDIPERKENKPQLTETNNQQSSAKNQSVPAIEKNSNNQVADLTPSVRNKDHAAAKSAFHLNKKEKRSLFYGTAPSQKENKSRKKSKQYIAKGEEHSSTEKLTSAPVVLIPPGVPKVSPFSYPEVKAVSEVNKTAIEMGEPAKSDTVAKNVSTEPAPVIVQKNKQSKNYSKWQWGITASAGIARVVQGGILNAFDKSAVLDASGNNTGSQVPGLNNGKAATINIGSNWSAGFFVQRTLSERVHLSAGLQYDYFSTQYNIGTRIDSSLVIRNNISYDVLVSNFYRNSSVSRSIYKSKYHLVELPVNLRVKFSKSNRLPFYWNSGLSVGRLFSTNALHYDGITGVYYKDNNLFQRTQVGLHTGLSFQLFPNSKYPLEVGPQFHYKFSRLLKVNNGDGRHLLSGSILFRWYLKK